MGGKPKFMKEPKSFTCHYPLPQAIASLALLLSLGVSSAQAQFSLGQADNYAVLFEGAGSGNKLNVNNGPGPGGLAVNGNIGIGGAGALQLSGPLTINGNVDFANTVVDNGPYSGNIVVNGSISGGSSAAQLALTTINNLSTTLGAETGTGLSINLNNLQSQTVNATDGTQDSGHNYVFTLSSLTFNNGATLTINGASSQYVVINVTANNPQFGGTIGLTGGITSDHVLFNVTGTGSTLQISANGATETGTFLDPNGTVSINHSVLDGRLFGGDSHDMSVVSGGYVDAPAVPEPTPIIAGIALLCIVLVEVGHKIFKRA
jgi:hypothetical protein